MTATLLLRNCRRYDLPETAAPVDILVENGLITQIGQVAAAPAGARELDAGGRRVIPGLIDLHIHGAGGADLLDGTPDALRIISSTLARHGVTGFLGTTVMRPAERNRHLPVAGGLVGARLGGARLLGLHLEGPFVNPEKRGGLPLEGIYPASEAALDEVLALTDGALRVMTIAPESPGHLRIIERLAAAGVIASFGHSAATYEETRAGIDAGIEHATHLYNAMTGLHHREPGPLVALHEDERIAVQVISDDVHVRRQVVGFTARAFGAARCALITDGMRTVGLPDGRYRFGDREYESRDGTARYLDGTLIGTSLSLLEIARRFQTYTNCSLAVAIDSASRTPARVLGLEARKGALAVGLDADLVLLEPDLSVRATVVAGEVVYEG
jgi:N-acetylglucosamine-6-phosphate deacetylase